MKKDKTVLVLSDFHCGHLVGLTPPSRHSIYTGSNKVLLKFEQVRQQLWDMFSKIIKSLGVIDVLIVNGDLIEGKGSRSGGTELITTDRFQQADMAAEIIRFIKPKKVAITYGTPYHTGDEEDFEKVIVKELRDGSNKYKPESISLASHLYLNINGVKFDCKHHIASSSVPYGRTTAISRENLWNLVWADTTNGSVPRSDVFIRSHVHYHVYSGDSQKLCMTTPALQGLGTKFGSRKCSGVVDWGVVVFNVTDKGEYTWRGIIPREVQQIQKVNIVTM